jgi:hypothetical protein
VEDAYKAVEGMIKSGDRVVIQGKAYWPEYSLTGPGVGKGHGS